MYLIIMDTIGWTGLHDRSKLVLDIVCQYESALLFYLYSITTEFLGDCVWVYYIKRW